MVCIDSFPYYGTDDLYSELPRAVREARRSDGQSLGPAWCRRSRTRVPDHLARVVGAQDMWCLHSAAWWRRHWERTGIVDMELADTMPDGWQRWLDWQRAVAPDNAAEIKALEADAAAYLATSASSAVGGRSGASGSNTCRCPRTTSERPLLVTGVLTDIGAPTPPIQRLERPRNAQMSGGIRAGAPRPPRPVPAQGIEGVG